MKIPNDLNTSQKLKYGADVVIRDVGYIPIVGAVVGVPRIITGIVQRVRGGKGSYSFSEGDMKVSFSGSKLAAKGDANIVRGIFESFCGGGALALYDAKKDDRWFLVPGWCPASRFKKYEAC